MTESFPRQEARTRRFSLGVPRAFRVSPDGSRVVYLRTKGGADPVTCLWVLDVAIGRARLAADPRTLSSDHGGGGQEEDLPPEERARRERVREQAGGIVAYATDRDVTVAAFALSGRVYTVPLAGAGAGGGPGRPRGGHLHPGAGSPPRPGRAAAGVRLRRRAAGGRSGRARRPGRRPR